MNSFKIETIPIEILRTAEYKYRWSLSYVVDNSFNQNSK